MKVRGKNSGPWNGSEPSMAQKQSSEVLNLGYEFIATLRVTEDFAKSLKVIRNDTVEKGLCNSTLVFY